MTFTHSAFLTLVAVVLFCITAFVLFFVDTWTLSTILGLGFLGLAFYAAGRIVP